MNLHDHDLLARRLAAWADEIIDHGRSPFRKAETWPAVISEVGEVRPLLVLWINRASLMAGGIVLFAQDNPDQALVAGQACARALGLRHFVTLSRKQISFWENSSGGPQNIKTLPLCSEAEVSEVDLRDRLVETMDELKLLAVLGALPPQKLGPHYLANLCRVPLDLSLPEMTTALRRARAEQAVSGLANGDDQAMIKGALTLLRLLALAAHDHLPETVQPEKLERAMELALPYLPGPLAELLAPLPGETPLGHSSAVRFHHLFRRLSQLSWGSDPEKAAATVALLIDHEGAAWGAAPLPQPVPKPRPLLLVNARQPDEISPARFYETADTPALLGAEAFLRDLRGEPAALLSKTDPASLSELPQPYAAVAGTLNASPPPDAGERERLRILLRTSWPMRRFSLPPRTPRWAWEWIHLIGLAAEAAQFHLRLPDTWLNRGYGQLLYGILCEQTTLFRLERAGTGTLVMYFRKGNSGTAYTQLQGKNKKERRLPWGELACAPLSYLALCLDLPDQMYRLVQDYRLNLRAWQQGRPDAGGLAAFARSTLGRYLWRVATGGENLPAGNKGAQLWEEKKIILPSEQVLAMLGEAAAHGDEQIDAELHRLLDFDAGMLPTAEAGKRPTRRRRQGISAAETEQMLTALLRDGRPRFPDQYLYDYYRPELQSYHLDGPLTEEQEFLGTFELRAENGAAVCVEGEETARSLILASYNTQGRIKLPRDRHITAEILARYQKDLQSLRQNFLREAHARLGEARLARSHARRLWDSLGLPPWELFEE